MGIKEEEIVGDTILLVNAVAYSMYGEQLRVHNEAENGTIMLRYGLSIRAVYMANLVAQAVLNKKRSVKVPYISFEFTIAYEGNSEERYFHDFLVMNKLIPSYHKALLTCSFNDSRPFSEFGSVSFIGEIGKKPKLRNILLNEFEWKLADHLIPEECKYDTWTAIFRNWKVYYIRRTIEYNISRYNKHTCK